MLRHYLHCFNKHAFFLACERSKQNNVYSIQSNLVPSASCIFVLPFRMSEKMSWARGCIKSLEERNMINVNKFAKSVFILIG